MPPSSPQFTPAQVLAAGRRAESESKPDLAEHFFRHVVEHYGATPEAASAREGLIRLGEQRGGHPLTAAAAASGSPPPLTPAAGAALPAAATNGFKTEVAARGDAGSGDEAPVNAIAPELVPTEPLVLPAARRASGRRYKAGRLMTWLVSTIGWLMVIAGLALVPLAWSSKAAELVPLLASPAGLAATAGWAAVQSFGGLILVLLAQVARAIFDMAEGRNTGGAPDDR